MILIVFYYIHSNLQNNFQVVCNTQGTNDCIDGLVNQQTKINFQLGQVKHHCIFSGIRQNIYNISMLFRV